MVSIEKQIVSRIYGKGRGWSFSKTDFLDIGSPSAVEQALSRLSRKETIRRVIRGVYDYPKYSKLLEKLIGPDLDRVAHAIARKNRWTIQITGNTALNLLGLSTQVPGRYMYLCDTRNIRYKIGGRELAFEKARLKDIGLKYDETKLLVQAIRALNKRELTEKEKEKIRSYLDDKKVEKVLKDARHATGWIYREIKEIFEEK